MSDYTKDSITVNMVVKVHSDKYTTPTLTYRGEPVTREITIDLIQQLIASGDFTAEFIPTTFTTTSTGTLIVEEKV
jgi:hypothetical protein